MNEFQKYENESDVSYIIRICDLKEESGLTWKEIAKEINQTLGFNYDESAYRKKYQYYKICSDAKDDDVAREKGMIDELEEKRIALKKEAYKLQTLRIDDNRKIREQARNDLMFEEVIRAIKDKNNSCKYEIGKNYKLLNQKKDEEFILSFADVHFGKEFTSIANKYSPEITYERFDKLFNEVVDLIKLNNISVLNICALGDLIEGMTLRVSQLQSLKIGIIDQVIKFSNFLISWIDKLSKYTKIKYYSVMSSNHTQIRPFGSKPNEFVGEDMERVIFAMLQNAFKDNDRVEIIESEDKFTTLDIFGYKIILLHGHEIKEIRNMLQDLSWKFKTFFDYAIVGHLHQSGVVCSGESLTNNCEVIRCPSIMGSDEYADQLMAGSKAGALLIKFTKEQGKRSIEDIILN